MTPEDRAALQALMEKATPGPWKRGTVLDARGKKRQEVWPEVNDPVRGPICHVLSLSADHGRAGSDASLIVAAVNALPALLSALEEAKAGWKHAIEALAENVNSRQEETVRAEKAESESAALRAEVETLTREARDLRSRSAADAEWMAQAVESIEGLTVTTPDFTGHPVVDVVRSLLAEVETLRGELARADRAVLSVEMLPDHACAECRPNSDLIVAGFRCVVHAAKARAALESEGT